MHPYKIRFGVGIGDINTGIDPEKAIGADGSAYHCAREALADLKKTEIQADESAAGNSSSFSVRFETGSADTLLLNLSCDFINIIMSKWSEKQWETIKVILLNNIL
jgi:hypothetical protein